MTIDFTIIVTICLIHLGNVNQVPSVFPKDQWILEDDKNQTEAEC